MASNNQKGGPEAAHWERFDALPPPFRRLLQYTNVDYQVWWVEKFIDRFGQAKAFDLTRRFLYTERRKTILEHYGPTHPQVRR